METSNKKYTVQESTNKVSYSRIKNDSNSNIEGFEAIGISPFDNFFLFSLTHEYDDSDKPLDLLNSGDIYINFLNNNEEIKLKNIPDNNSDLKNGEVVFKIPKDEARKILTFSNNDFYITSKKTLSGTESSESVIYFGKFYKDNEIPEFKIKTQLSELQKKYNTDVLSLNTQNTKLNDTITDLNDTIDKLLTTNNELEKINKSLKENLENLKSKVSSEVVKEIENISNVVKVKETHKKIVELKQNVIKKQNNNINVEHDIPKVLGHYNGHTTNHHPN